MNTLLLSALALFLSCTKLLSATLDGAWVLSEKWEGFMGLALVVDGERYTYWFSSDVSSGKEQRYPLSGRVVTASGNVHLIPDSSSTGHLYDTTFHPVVYRGEICLLAASHYARMLETGEIPSDRLLHQLSDFDVNHPPLNRPLLPSCIANLNTSGEARFASVEKKKGSPIAEQHRRIADECLSMAHSTLTNESLIKLDDRRLGAAVRELNPTAVWVSSKDVVITLSEDPKEYHLQYRRGSWVLFVPFRFGTGPVAKGLPMHKAVVQLDDKAPAGRRD